MQIWHIWIIIGILLFIGEVFTPGFFLASLGVGAFVAALVAWLDGSFTWQIVAVAIGTLVTSIGSRPLFRLLHHAGSDGRTSNAAALVGQRGKVLEAICNIENRGRVKIGGEEWKALASNGGEIEPDATVTIDRIEGATAYVTQLEGDQ